MPSTTHATTLFTIDLNCLRRKRDFLTLQFCFQGSGSFLPRALILSRVLVTISVVVIPFLSITSWAMFVSLPAFTSPHWFWIIFHSVPATILASAYLVAPRTWNSKCPVVSPAHRLSSRRIRSILLIILLKPARNSKQCISRNLSSSPSIRRIDSYISSSSPPTSHSTTIFHAHSPLLIPPSLPSSILFNHTILRSINSH
jgi:hypothetical protein